MDDMKAELDAIFDNHATKQREAKETEAKKADEAEQFLHRFQLVQNEVISPAMDSITAYVREKGYRSQVSYQADETDNNGRACPAQITFTLFDGPGHGRDIDWPHFTFQCDKTGRKVNLFESTISPNHGGHGGSAGSVNIDAVTEDYVKQKLINLIRALFK